MFFITKAGRFLFMLVSAAMLMTGCNKDLPSAQPIEDTDKSIGPTIAELLNAPEYSIFKSAAAKGGILSLLADTSLRFTAFIPDNNAMMASGLSQAAVDFLPKEQVAGLISYHIVPQKIAAGQISTDFPNMEYPSILNPAPALSNLLRLSTFPSKRGSNVWINNIPVIATDISAGNGLVQKVAAVVAPPNQFLWDRISVDSNLTYLKAAILRADSGVAAANSLVGYLSTIGPNFTVFAPNDAAFKNTLIGAIFYDLIAVFTQQLIDTGYTPEDAAITAPFLALTRASTLAASPEIFQNPSLFGTLSAEKVKGIVVYHILGERAFTVNLPETASQVPTLLNMGVPNHPGLKISATFGPMGVTAASVDGQTNSAPARIKINPLPNGTSDQHYINGVLHVIDQVMLP